MTWSAIGRALRHPELGRLRRWAAVFIEFSLVQALIQLVGAVTGIVVVRLVDTHDYALYTIANSVLGAFVVLADCGVGAAAIGIGGRVWEDPEKLGGVAAAARRAIATMRNIVGIPVTVALVLLLAKNDAAPAEIAALVAIVLVGGALSLYNSVDLSVVRLLGNMRLIQNAGLAATGLRLLATLLFAAVGLVAETAMSAVAAGWAVQCWAMRRWTRGKIRADAPIPPSVRAELGSVIRAQLPNNLNFVFQGQLTIWLLSTFGTPGGVADLGAVTRISVIVAVLHATMQSVIIPRYARCQDPRRLGTLYAQICAGFAVLVMVPVALVALMPEPVLWILGANYRHLPGELVLAVLSASIGSLCSLAWLLNANRAWYPPPWIWIPLGIVSQLGLAALIGVGTARQVLLVSVYGELVLLAANFAAATIFIRRFRRRAAMPVV